MDFEEATLIYFQHANQSGTIPQQPSGGRLHNGVWHLHNANGEVARVHVATRRVL